MDEWCKVSQTVFAHGVPDLSVICKAAPKLSRVRGLSGPVIEQEKTGKNPGVMRERQREQCQVHTVIHTVHSPDPGRVC